MKKILLALCLTPLLVLATENDSLFIRQLSEEIMRRGKAYDHLRDLTKKIGHRISGSEAYNKASSWGAKVMKESGADAVELQECMVPNWKRGGKDEAYLLQKDGKTVLRPIQAVALGNSMGSGAKGVTGEVIAFSNFGELEAARDKVKGKIVFFNHAFDPAEVLTFRSYGAVGAYRRSSPGIVAKYGAVGLMIRSLSDATDNFPHTGSTAYNDSFPKIPAMALGLRDADAIWEAYQQGEKMYAKLVTHGRFAPDTIAHNVIGEIKGTEFPDEIITVGGHLDSWDIGEGAHDDGAGCVQTIEILRSFRALGYQPKRTIRFVLFANEENGLRGATAYADRAKQRGEKHVFALESDAGGFTPRAFGVTAKGEQFQKIRSWLPLLKPYGIDNINPGGGGADIGPLNRAFGTPVAGLSPDSQRYFDYHHAQSDVFEAVNKRELHLGAVTMAALIYLVDKYGL